MKKFTFDIYYGNSWQEEIVYETETYQEALDSAIQEASDNIVVEAQACEHYGERKNGVCLECGEDV